MAGAFIKTSLDTGPAIDLFRRIIEHVDNVEPLFGQIGDYLIESTEDRFDREEAPDGTPWAPLSPEYAARKRKNADKILVLDAIMRDTLAYNASARELEFGTNRIQGATHQFGRDEIPARPFIGVNDTDEDEILALTREYVELVL